MLQARHKDRGCLNCSKSNSKLALVGTLFSQTIYMNWRIDSTSLPSYLRVSTEGDVSSQDFTSMWNDILAQDGWVPGTSVFFDNRGLNAVPQDGSGVDMTSIATDYFESRAVDIGAARIAILMKVRENYKYGRQFQIGVELRRVPVKLQMFFDEAEALSWLVNGKL